MKKIVKILVKHATSISLYGCAKQVKPKIKEIQGGNYGESTNST